VPLDSEGRKRHRPAAVLALDRIDCSRRVLALPD
jgi:hypothetical protein